MNTKRILLLGNTSFTGSHVLHRLNNSYSFTCVGRDSAQSDVTFDVSRDSLDLLESELSQADVVINCFSNGDVDNCELNPEPSAQLNLEFPKVLCDAQKQHDFHLIHFSSNAVYDGENPLYSEDSEHLPVNAYGSLKSQADNYLKSHSDRCTLLRPITMYGQLLGAQRHNPFSFFFDRLQKNEAVQCVDDVYVNMLHVDVLVECIQKAIDNDILDEFNISGDEVINRFEFVSEIKKHLPNSTSAITKTDSSKFKTAARRPLNTSFDNTLMKSTLGVFPATFAQTIERLVHEAVIAQDSAKDQKKAA